MIERSRQMLRFVRRYPSVVGSLTVILALVGISLYAVIAIPLSEVLVMWNSAREETWQAMPRAVPPAWTNLFRREPLPLTLIVPMSNSEPTVEILSETVWQTTTEMTFDYGYSTFPPELAFAYEVHYGTRRPLVVATWIKPDGEETELLRRAAPGGPHKLRLDPVESLTSGEHGSTDASPSATKGRYTLRVTAMVFEADGFSLDGQLILFGGVHGIAGTDTKRRDLGLALLWGTPVALLFGILAAAGTTLLGFTIAAVGAWFGGIVDAGIQRLTEVNMMIPFLPTIMMVGWFYSSSIWILFAFILGFSIFTGRLKSYRATFLQVVDAPYIEAARAYGASSWRIVFRYLVPRVFPVVLPQVILAIPLFVFLEASLAFLGIADPLLISWGKMLSETRESLYIGYYHCVLGPAFMLLVTSLSFSVLGYTLDRVFNPRLRNV